MKHTILLIDDSPTDADLVRRSLSKGPGAPRLIIADDGAEALRILRETPRGTALPDLILLDLNMPPHSGFRILSEIKSDPVLRPIPVVIMTSSQAECDVSNAYGLLANCYIAKPMDIDGFADTLRDIETFWFSRAILPSHH